MESMDSEPKTDAPRPEPQSTAAGQAETQASQATSPPAGQQGRAPRPPSSRPNLKGAFLKILKRDVSGYVDILQLRPWIPLIAVIAALGFIVPIINWLSTKINPTTPSSSIIISIASFPIIVVVMFIPILLLIHAACKIFGGKAGLSETALVIIATYAIGVIFSLIFQLINLVLSILANITTSLTCCLSSIIMLLSIGLGIYMVVLLVLGVATAHQISNIKAIIAVIVPALLWSMIVAVGMLILGMGLFMTVFSSMSGT